MQTATVPETVPRTIPAVTPSTRQAALMAGVGYLAIFVLAIFANFVVLEGLVVSGDPAATATNLAESTGLFRAGIVAFTVIFVLDVVIAWALHLVFRSVGRDVSLLAAWLRLTYTVMLGVGLVFAFVALRLLDGIDGLDAASTDAQILLAMDGFEFAWLIGLVAFGLHLAALGVLVVRSGIAHRVLGYALGVAGTMYIVDTLARVVLSDYAGVESVFLVLVAVPSVVAELGLTIWLLRSAGRAAVSPSTV